MLFPLIFNNIHSPCSEVLISILSSGSRPTVVFAALSATVDGIISGVLTGTGDITVSRTTTQYVLADTGYYNGFTQNHPGYRGRYVKNLLEYSEDFSNAVWTKTNVTVTPGLTDSDGGTTGYTLKATSAFGLLRYYPVGSTGNTFDFVSSIWVKRISGTGVIRFYGANTTSYIDIGPQLTSEWKRFSFPVTDVDNLIFQLRVDSINDEVGIAFSQTEIVDNNVLDTTTPSEYVANDTAKDGASDVTVNGSFDTDTDWTKDSGWSISGGKAVAAAAVGNIYSLTSQTVSGVKYFVTFVVSDYSGGTVRANLGGTSGSVQASANGTFTDSIICGSGGQKIAVDGVTAFTGSIDSISVVEATTGIEVFSTTNGNTVASNVVTAGAGTELTDWGLQVDPALTNKCLQSNTFGTTWTQTNLSTATQTEVGITGQANTAWDLRDTDAVNFGYLQQVLSGFTANTNPITARIRVKKEASRTTNLPAFGLGVGGAAKGVSINLDDGSLINRATLAPDASAVLSVGDFWEVYIQVANGSITNPNITFFPGADAAGNGTWAGTTQGNAIATQIEVFENTTIAQVYKTGPIFTTTASASSDSQITYFSQANHNNNAGALFLEVTPSWSTATDPGSGQMSLYLLGNATSDSPAYFNSASEARLRSYDETSSVLYDNTAFVGGTTYKMGSIWHKVDNYRIVGVDGNYGTAGAYDADGFDLSGGVIGITSTFRSMIVRNYKLATGGSSTQLKTWVDEQMV